LIERRAHYLLPFEEGKWKRKRKKRAVVLRFQASG
jgi:hypothetical protein